MSDTQESPSVDDLTPEEANRIIHSHRKVRYGRSPVGIGRRAPSGLLTPCSLQVLRAGPAANAR